MITTAATIRLPEPPGELFHKGWPGYHSLGHAGRQLWEYLWEATRFGTTEVTVTDRQIADACGRCQRWVQKALRQLLDCLGPDGSPRPAIDRSRRVGPRAVACRVIQIVVRFVEPRRAEPAAEARPGQPSTGSRRAARHKAEAGQIPNVGFVRPTTPEQAAAAAARVAQVEEIPEPTPEELAETRRILDEIRRQAQGVPSTKPLDVQPPRHPARKHTQEELLEQLARGRRMREAEAKGTPDPGDQGGPPPQPAAP